MQELRIHLVGRIHIMRKTNTQEKIIKFLLELDRPNNDNVVHVSRTNIEPLSLTEEEVVRYLHELEAIHYIRIQAKSVNNDLSRFAVIELLAPCLQYFEMKAAHKKLSKKEVWKEIRAWATLLVAIIALFVSIFSSCSKLSAPLIDEAGQEAVQSDIVTTPQMSDGDVYPTMTN